MKKATIKLSESSRGDNTLLFAIASAESDLRICLILNQALSINLSLTDNLELIIKKNIVLFRRYTYEGEEGIEKYTMFINRNETNYLFPEIKKIDFILLVQSEGSLTSVEKTIDQLKSAPEFTAIYKLDPTALKSFDRLIS